jgi:hypothetical protein
MAFVETKSTTHQPNQGTMYENRSLSEMLRCRPHMFPERSRNGSRQSADGNRLSVTSRSRCQARLNNPFGGVPGVVEKNFDPPQGFFAPPDPERVRGQALCPGWR